MSKRPAKAIPKATYALDSPYPEIQWPAIEHQDQAVILDLLCSLLTPIGEHRSKYIITSKGKRDKKRKRRPGHDSNTPGENVGSKQEPELPPAPKFPETNSSITIGFNHTVRCLESAARISTPKPLQSDAQLLKGRIELPTTANLAAVFVDRSSQAPAMNSPLPILVATASRARPTEPAIRLVALPAGASARFSAALGIPRVGIVGLVRTRPNMGPLMETVLRMVVPVQAPWLNQVQNGIYWPVEIKVVQTGARNLQREENGGDREPDLSQLENSKQG